MKKVFYMAAIAALAFSCTTEIEGPETVDYVQKEYTAELENNTKTSIDAFGKVSWAKGDVIRYYSKDDGTVSECTVDASGASTPLSLEVANDASFLVAVYGGSSVDYPSSYGFKLFFPGLSYQSGKFEDAHISVAKTCDVSQPNLTFSNLTCFIKFTLERSDVSYIIFSSNDNTALHSGGTIRITFSEEVPSVSLSSPTWSYFTVKVGSAGTFYISTLPTKLAKGFTIKCYDSSDNYIGEVKSEKSITIERNTILNLGSIDSRIVGPESDKPEIVYEPNLSKNGTANCYIVPIAGEYYFDATVKGSSIEPISGTIANASTLWESFGTDTAPSVGDIVKDVRYENGRVYFTAAGNNGNAVIAITNSDGEILWSWHIWCCMGYDADFYAQKYKNNAGTMMDRNIGATSDIKGDVHALGLLFQWGRKDPFLSGNAIKSTKSTASAASTITRPAPENTSDHLSDNNTLAYATANPTVFLLNSYHIPKDWYCTSVTYLNDTLWASTKTAYDPCPVGYRVPDGGYSGIWQKAFGTSINTKYLQESSLWDSTNRVMDFGCLGSGKIWYPASGYISTEDTYRFGEFGTVGYSGYYWGCTTYGYYGCCFSFNSAGYIHPNYTCQRAYGLSVRCQKEQ